MMEFDGTARTAWLKRPTLWVLIALAGIAVLIGAGLGVHFAGGPATIGRDAGADLHALPEIRFQDGKEKTLSLVDFRSRVVLLNLWATWCVPCRKEMPALDRLQKKLGGPGFEVVAVSIDDNPQAVREFYHQYGIKSLALYIDPSANAVRTLGAVGIPTTLLVDRDSRQIWRRVGPAEWDAPASLAEIGEHLKSGPTP